MRNLFLFFIALTVAPAWADMAKPAAITPLIHADAPVGEGTYKRLFLEVYKASLWADDAWSMQAPFALSITYKMDIDSDDLVDTSIEEMQHIKTLSQEQEANYRKELARVFPSVHNNDNITAIYVPKNGVTFYYNDKPYGSIADNAFAERFFAIWLSPQTSDPQLRQELLGKI